MKGKIIAMTATVAALTTSVIFLLNKRRETDILLDATIPRLTVTSPAFENLSAIPDKYTGRGEDMSPPLELSELAEGAESVAIIMDDPDVPWKANFTHWVIWDIPAITHIPEGISHGERVSELNNAVQGVAFGRNRYRGPMPPFGTHRYQFHIFVLDTKLNLESSSGRKELISAMEDHILQYGTLTGWYPREAN